MLAVGVTGDISLRMSLRTSENKISDAGPTNQRIAVALKTLNEQLGFRIAQFTNPGFIMASIT